MSDGRANTWLAAVVRLKCPRCRKGNLFPTKSFAFREPFEMYQNCPNCDQTYWPEPGFYYGAMFLSYILFCFPFLGLVLILRFVVGLPLITSMGILAVLAGLGFVYIFRVSRSLWLAINVRYDQAVSDAVGR